MAGDSSGLRVQQTSRLPVPDPTVLTTQQLQREIATAREIIETRINGGDKAIELLQKITDRIPSLIIEAVSHLRTLHEEKFASIATQFTERDKRTEQLSLADKTAIAAALQAQKEAAGAQNESNAAAITKSEAAFTKQIDQIGALMQTVTKNFDDKINDLKSRIDKGEGHSRGLGDGWGYIVGAAGILIAIITTAGFVLKVSGQ